MTKEEQAAVIGFWRQGAQIEQIIWIMGVQYDLIEKVINEYKQIIQHDIQRSFSEL